jgi:predicted metallopeptidase
MPTEWWTAPEVEEIAEKLIAEHHPHLADVKIRYVFRDEAAKSRGRTVLGKARKISGLNAHLVGLVGRNHVDGEVDFFVIEVASDTWRQLDDKQRVALVDHELCHLNIEEPEDATKDRKLVLRGHDLEEFTEIVQRHGLWKPDVDEFARAVGQLTIDDQLKDVTVVQFRATKDGES